MIPINGFEDMIGLEKQAEGDYSYTFKLAGELIRESVIVNIPPDRYTCKIFRGHFCRAHRYKYVKRAIDRKLGWEGVAKAERGYV